MSIEALVASKPLLMGATGDVVRQVQLALKTAGYSLTGTGWLGRQPMSPSRPFRSAQVSR